jgi:ribosomal protein S27E
MRLSKIACPFCGQDNEYDADEQETILCSGCDQLIFIPEGEKEKADG